MMLLRALRFPLTPFVDGASTSMSSTGPMRMDTPGSTWLLEGCSLSNFWSTSLGICSADFARAQALAWVGMLTRNGDWRRD